MKQLGMRTTVLCTAILYILFSNTVIAQSQDQLAQFSLTKVNWNDFYTRNTTSKELIMEYSLSLSKQELFKGLAIIDIPVLIPANILPCKFSNNYLNDSIEKQKSCSDNYNLKPFFKKHSYDIMWQFKGLIFHLIGTNLGFDTTTSKKVGLKKIPDALPTFASTETGIDINFVRFGVSYLLSVDCSAIEEDCNNDTIQNLIETQINLLIPFIVKESPPAIDALNIDLNPIEYTERKITFDYTKPGTLSDGVAKSGVNEKKNYDVSMIFPIKYPDAYANSQVYNIGGGNLKPPVGYRGASQCYETNRQLPWEDTFCEWRHKKGKNEKNTPRCTARGGKGHQGLDIRGPSCGNQNLKSDKKTRKWLPEDWVVAVKKGKLRVKPSSVILTPTDDKNASIYYYLHLDVKSLKETILKAEGNPFNCKKQGAEISDEQLSAIWTCDEIPKGHKIAKISSTVKGSLPDVPTTTTHLHFEIKQKSNQSGKIEHIPLYYTLILAYQKLLDTYNKPSNQNYISEPLDVDFYLDANDQYDKFTNLQYGLQKNISSNSLYRDLKLNFKKVSPLSLLNCLNKEEAKRAGFLNKSATYDITKIKKVLNTLLSIEKRKGKLELTKSSKLLKEYIQQRTLHIQEYNQAIVLCYRFEVDGSDGNQQYPIYVVPLAVSNLLQKSINFSQLAPVSVSNLSDFLKFIQTSFLVSKESSNIQNRSKLTNYSTEKEWATYSNSKKDVVNLLYYSTNETPKVDDLVKELEVQISRWLGLESHNVTEAFMNQSEEIAYLKGDEKELEKYCKSLVEINGDSFVIKDRDWYTSRVTDTATSVGLYNKVGSENPPNATDFNCFKYQRSKIDNLIKMTNRKVDSFKFYNSKSLLMNNDPSLSKIITDDQLRVVNENICKIKGKENIESIVCD